MILVVHTRRHWRVGRPTRYTTENKRISHHWGHTHEIQARADHPNAIHAIRQKVIASLTSAPIESTMIAPATPAFVGVSDVAQLTEREREILALLARGASNREISETLYIAGGTVKNHLSNILGKLGVRDRTQAALKARELGLL
jgi:DNA-binding NarL/FixJ family response regulator